MNDDELKLGIDFHGVITADPAYFKIFIDEAVRRGFDIHILTGAARADVVKVLNAHNIKYGHIFSILDYYKEKNLVEFYADGNFHVDDYLWDNAKARYCNEVGIHFHIDDGEKYSKDMKCIFCLYDDGTKKCNVKDRVEIDFTKSFDDIFSKINSVLKQ